MVTPNVHHLLFAFRHQQEKSAIDKSVCPVLGLDNEICIIHSGSSPNIYRVNIKMLFFLSRSIKSFSHTVK